MAAFADAFAGLAFALVWFFTNDVYRVAWWSEPAARTPEDIAALGGVGAWACGRDWNVVDREVEQAACRPLEPTVQRSPGQENRVRTLSHIRNASGPVISQLSVRPALSGRGGCAAKPCRRSRRGTGRP